MHLPQNTPLQNGKFRIVKFLNSGGFGCTYEAEHVLFHKRVAIKEFFVKSFCNRDSQTCHVTVPTQNNVALITKLRKKFIDEAAAINQMHHPNIVNVSDVFEENGTAYYVMDFIDGQSLNDMIKSAGPLSEERALRYIRQVADALRYVHSKNRLHLDIKPGNIMVDGDDNAILIDFGASKQYDEENGENTSSIVGKTPGYAPLEQMSSKIQNFAPATDIYSLGATFYKLLTGLTPPDATDRADDDSALQPLPARISPTTRQAVTAAMQVRRKERPQSIDAFLALLDHTVAPSKDEDITFINPDKVAVVERHSDNAAAAERSPQHPKKEQPKVQAQAKHAETSWWHKGQNKIMIATLAGLGLVGGLLLPNACGNTAPIEVLTETVPKDADIIHVTNITWQDSRGVNFTYTGEALADNTPQGEGEGVYTYGHYEGAYANGLRHGQGKFTTKSGDSFEGNFIEDTYEHGTFRCANDGSYFVGDFHNGSPYTGKWYKPDGTLDYKLQNGK